MSKDRDVSTFKHLLSPLHLGRLGAGLELRNRVLVSAHVPGFAEQYVPGQAYIDYHRRYAVEGVGLQMTGGTPVHRSGLLSMRPDALWNLDDRVIPGYQRLSQAIHAEGGRILAQLAHSGGTVKIDEPGITTWSVSAIRSAVTGHVSHPMSIDEIGEIIGAYASAAGRVREGGLDGVEILAAFGFLPQAFLSPLTNFREDAYGGDLSHRMRFLIEVLKAVRAELTDEQILGVRLPGDEFEPGGLTLEDMKTVCRELSQQGLIDYINVTAHTNFTHTGRSKHWAPTPTKHGVFVHLASAIKAEVSVPVFTVGRVVDPAHAERIIADGHADAVGMTRAHICDPAIVRKVINNQASHIRPCVGANTCIANRYAGKTIRCMHNPELKSPGKIFKPATSKKTVTVIGAGPAGLEAARLCAVRGHQVTLHERSSRPGGQLNYWTAVKSMHELRGIVRWRMSELDRLGVAIHFDSDITDTTLSSIKADHIVIATGAMETRRELSGDNLPKIVTPMQLLAMDTIEAERALIISDGRGQAGLVCAEWLADRGVNVEIITEDVAVANDLDPTNRDAWYDRLGRLGVVFTAQTIVQKVVDGRINLINPFTQRTEMRDCYDVLIDWNGCRSTNPFTGYSDNLKEGPPMHVIGDCSSPRSVELAMAEALQVAERI